MKIGDRVLAIGNPYGIGISVSNGIISATGRDYGNPYLQLIQTLNTVQAQEYRLMVAMLYRQL